MVTQSKFTASNHDKQQTNAVPLRVSFSNVEFVCHFSLSVLPQLQPNNQQARKGSSMKTTSVIAARRASLPTRTKSRRGNELSLSGHGSFREVCVVSARLVLTLEFDQQTRSVEQTFESTFQGVNTTLHKWLVEGFTSRYGGLT